MMLTDRYWPEVRSSAHLLYELSREMVQRGHDVTVVTRVPDDYLSDGSATAPAGWSSVNGVSVLRLATRLTTSKRPIFRGLDQMALRWTLRNALRGLSGRADVALVYSPPLPLASAARAYERQSGCPFVLNVQDLYPQTAIDLGLMKSRPLIRFAERMEAKAYESAARIVVHSSGNRAFLQERKQVGDKVRVIYNWVDLDAVRPGDRHNAFRRQFNFRDRFVISYAGVMGYAQDLSPVITAAAQMSGDADVVFVLVGDGVLRARWEAMAAELRASNVVFLPMQSKETYSELLAASDACLVPLDGTLTTPVVPGKLQAIMAAGRPAVALARAGGDTPKLVDASGAGICLDPSDAAGLREVLRSLKSAPEVGREMGMRGRRFAEAHFSLKQAADDYEALFVEVGRKTA